MMKRHWKPEVTVRLAPGYLARHVALSIERRRAGARKWIVCGTDANGARHTDVRIDGEAVPAFATQRAGLEWLQSLGWKVDVSRIWAESPGYRPAAYVAPSSSGAYAVVGGVK